MVLFRPVAWSSFAGRPESERVASVWHVLGQELRRRREGYRYQKIDEAEMESDGSLALLRAVRAHKPSLGPLEPLVRLCVRRAMIDAAKREATRKRRIPAAIAAVEDEDGDLVTSPVQNPADGRIGPVEQLIAKETLDGLPPRTRRIVELVKEGKTFDAIGAELGMSRSYANEIYLRAISKFSTGQRAPANVLPNSGENAA